ARRDPIELDRPGPRGRKPAVPRSPAVAAGRSRVIPLWAVSPPAALPREGQRLTGASASRRLGDRNRRLQGMEVDVEERFLLIALLLVLLADPDDLAKDLHVEAVAFGFGVDGLFVLGEPLDLLLELLDALDERPQLIPCNSTGSGHGFSSSTRPRENPGSP